MYSIFDWKEFELLSYRWTFLESTEISATEEPNALEKGTSSVYGIADIKWEGTNSVYGIAEIKPEGTSSVYTISEIKLENSFSSFVLHE